MLSSSRVAAALAKFLGTSIQVLNIGGIGLGSSGFMALQVGIQGALKLVNIDIRFRLITHVFLNIFYSASLQN